MRVLFLWPLLLTSFLRQSKLYLPSGGAPCLGIQLMEEALSLARQMAAKPPSGVRMAKRALVKPTLEGLEAALDYEATAQMTSYASPEMRQALASLRRR